MAGIPRASLLVVALMAASAAFARSSGDALSQGFTNPPDSAKRSHDLPDGMTYRLLVLPPTTQMTPEVPRKLHELVAAGPTISGPRPLSSPSLLHYPDSDTEVHSLATDLWGGIDGVTLNQHSFGKGTTYSGLSIDETLSRLKVAPDLHPASHSKIRLCGSTVTRLMLRFIS
jgi:hypothetical protein